MAPKCSRSGDYQFPASYRHSLLRSLENVDLVDAAAPDFRSGPDNAWRLSQLLVQGLSVAMLRNLRQKQQQQQQRPMSPPGGGYA